MLITDIDTDAAEMAAFYADLREGYGKAHTGTNHPSNPNWAPTPEPAYTVESGGSYPNGTKRYEAAAIRFNRP